MAVARRRAWPRPKRRPPTTRRIISALISHGVYRRAYLGISGRERPLYAREARRLSREQHTGVEVAEVEPGGPAYISGVRAGDVIVNLDGERVIDPGKLLRIVDKHKVGDKIKIRYRRDGQYKTVAVTLGAMPERLAPPWARPRPATRPARPASRPARKAG